MKISAVMSLALLLASGCMFDLFIDDAPECEGGMYDWENELCWQHPADAEERSWEEAEEYCGDLELGGHGDWRLPSKEELYGLFDDCEKDESGWYLRRCDNCCSSAQCSVMFCKEGSFGFWELGSSAGDYWTSTVVGDEAWVITFDYGWVGLKPVTSSLRPRCVRAD